MLVQERRDLPDDALRTNRGTPVLYLSSSALALFEAQADALDGVLRDGGAVPGVAVDALQLVGDLEH